MNYVLCPKCKKTQPAVILDGRKIVCGKCGAELKLKGLSNKMCPDCRSLLYAPPADLEMALFPCREDHKRQKEARKILQAAREAQEAAEKASEKAAENAEEPAEATVAEAAQDEDTVLVLCPVCHQQVAVTKGITLHRCAFCDYPISVPAASQGDADASAPIQLKYAFAPGELVHVDSRSSAIPPESVLIVGVNQSAAYMAGGRTRWFSEAGTFAPFDDRRTEEEIMAAIYQGNTSADSSQYRIDTQLIFFNRQVQSCAFSVDFALRDGKWRITLPVTLGYCLHAPENLLRNSWDFSDSAAVADRLAEQVRMETERRVSEKLLDIPAERIEEAQSAEDIRRLLSDVLCLAEGELLRRATLSLTQRFGLQVTFLQLSAVQADVLDADTCSDQLCPVCGRTNLVRKGMRGAFTCACGARLSWCDVCGRFTLSVRTPTNEEMCADCKIYLKK